VGRDSMAHSIFASTASAILIPSLSPTPPVSAGNRTPNADDTQSRKPPDGIEPLPVVRKLSLLAMAKKETARRGLYSRFSRGTTLCKEPTPEPEPALLSSPVSRPVQPSGTPSCSSSSNAARDTGEGEASKSRPQESKEERRIRRAAKLARREAKSLRKQEKAARKAAKSDEVGRAAITWEEVNGVDADQPALVASKSALTTKSKRKRGKDSGQESIKRSKKGLDSAS
jgi:hypothetical protein